MNGFNLEAFFFAAVGGISFFLKYFFNKLNKQGSSVQSQETTVEKLKETVVLQCDAIKKLEVKVEALTEKNQKFEIEFTKFTLMERLHQIELVMAKKN